MKTQLKIKEILSILIFLPFFIYFLGFCNPDSDSFFLAATGKYIIENKTIPTTNPFTVYNANIIVQQWLVCILNYFLLSNNLTLIYSILIFITMNIFVFMFGRLFLNDTKLILYTLPFTSIGLVSYATTRPNSITLIMFILLLFVLEKYNKTNNKKYLYILLIISLIEINCHAAMWPIFIFFIFIYMLPKTIPNKNIINWLFVKNKQNILTIFIFSLLFMLVGLLNPNFLNGPLYLLKSVNAANILPIGEMAHPKLFSISSLFIFVYFILTFIYILKYKENVNIRYILMSFVSIIFALMYIRNQYFVAIFTLPILFSLLKLVKLDKKEPKNIVAKNVILLVFIITLQIILNPFSIQIKEDSSYPISMLSLIDKDKNVFTGYNLGSFLEYNGYKIYIDARAEIFGKNIAKTNDYIKEYKSVLDGTIDYKSFIEKYNFDYILIDDEIEYKFNDYLSNNTSFIKILSKNGYTLYMVNN